jgi:hypothetical protein
MRYGERARATQAQFRRSLPNEARSPDDPVGLRNGHLLALGYEAYNLYPGIRDTIGPFFASRGVKWWTSARSGDVGEDHPTRNLASSQIACVNTLYPLAAHPEVLLAFARALDPEVESLLPIPDPLGNPPSLVEFEWVGWSAPIEGGRVTRGANQTSADALLLTRTARGVRALVIEWKYCEEYRYPEDKGVGPSGQTRLRRYTGRYEAPDSAFRADIPVAEFLFEPYYQLFRLRLLADELVRSGIGPGQRVDDAAVIVVCPTGNEDYLRPVARTPLARRFPAAGTVHAVMQATLKDPAGVRHVGIREAMREVFDAAWAANLGDWLNYHAARYQGWGLPDPPER